MDKRSMQEEAGDLQFHKVPGTPPRLGMEEEGEEQWEADCYHNWEQPSLLFQVAGVN